eukprot:UN5076
MVHPSDVEALVAHADVHQAAAPRLLGRGRVLNNGQSSPQAVCLWSCIHQLLDLAFLVLATLVMQRVDT